MTRHFDVVVLGRSLGSLSAAALLARRDFRVLLLGQGQRPQAYSFEQRVFCRRAFSMLFASSPVFKRLLQELAQTQRFRQRVRDLDPMFCFLGTGRRVQVPPDMQLFAREVEREFPEVRQLVEELYSSFASVNAAADAVFERDAAWPPGTFWERFETNRLAAALPLTSKVQSRDLLGRFPPGHPFSKLVGLPAVAACDLAVSYEELPPFALARLHGSWTRGVQELPGGEEELVRFLVDRIKAHGGECWLEARAREVVVRRGRAVGVRLDGDEEPTGAGAIVCDLPGEGLAELAGGAGITKDAQKSWPRVAARVGRFVVSVVVKEKLLPEPLGHHAFLLPDSSTAGSQRRPPVQLQVFDAKMLLPAAGVEGEKLLVAEMLLPRSGPLTVLEAREAVLDTLREHFPFLNEHLVMVDSPHDGLPLYLYEGGRKREMDRVHVRGSSPEAEAMQWQWAVEPSGYLGLGGEPVRGPIPGTYLVGTTVLPGLGQEGQLLAAQSAVRIITHKDRARQKLRRQMWTKVET
ncbi:MAG: phytoene dehydrogenase [Polyangiaceae bacterium]|nr:phytoene dehydrogenase [Polyangiaceae bacterium]